MADKELTSDDLAFDPKDTLVNSTTQKNTNDQKPQLKDTHDKVLDPDAQKPNHRPEGRND